MQDTLNRLYHVVEQRRNASPETSYVARLFEKGQQKISQKVGEEAVELALAGTGGDKTAMIQESADLLFHLLVFWNWHGITPDDVAAELVRREGVSGIEEKNSRKGV